MSGAAVLSAGRPDLVLLRFFNLFVRTYNLVLCQLSSNPRATCVLDALLEATPFYRRLCGFSFHTPSSEFSLSNSSGPCLFVSVVARLPLSALISLPAPSASHPPLFLVS